MVKTSPKSLVGCGEIMCAYLVQAMRPELLEESVSTMRRMARGRASGTHSNALHVALCILLHSTVCRRGQPQGRQCRRQQHHDAQKPNLTMRRICFGRRRRQEGGGGGRRKRRRGKKKGGRGGVAIVLLLIEARKGENAEQMGLKKTKEPNC